MITFTKIEDNFIILKIIENNNIYSFFVKIPINRSTLNSFKELFKNLQKKLPYKVSFESNSGESLPVLSIEIQESIIIFDNNNIVFKINKSSEIVDLFDKIITNLMIFNLENECTSPRRIV
jgi:hypothetical protein